VGFGRRWSQHPYFLSLNLWHRDREPLGRILFNKLIMKRNSIAIDILPDTCIEIDWRSAYHQFDSLWMFHKVHHNDPCLNVSTGFRIHITELLITHLLKAIMIIVLGIDVLTVLANEVVTTLFIMLHHSNITFKGEKWFGCVFIVPYLHRTHHSIQRNEHDRNYGAILSIWDRIFGTLSELEPLEIGIKGNSPLDFVNLVRFNFTLSTPPTPRTVNLESMIAEAAYYRAEKRNFSPGQALNDWLEAKKKLTNWNNEQGYSYIFIINNQDSSKRNCLLPSWGF